jgi:hypothetical protein
VGDNDGVGVASAGTGTSGDACMSGVAGADGVGAGVAAPDGVGVAVTDGVGQASTGRMGSALNAAAGGPGVTIGDGVRASGSAYDMTVITSEPVPPTRAASSATLTAAHRMVHPTTLVPMAPTP